MLCDAIGLKKGDMLTVVGAGGKSSLLMTMGRELQNRKWPFLLSSTTKMFYFQVSSFAPVISDQYESGSGSIKAALACYGYAAWLSSQRDDKVMGIPAEWIDSFYAEKNASPDRADDALTVLIEGDGARQRLLKVPGDREPVIPKRSTKVAGVLNIQAIGQELSPRIVHRYEQAVRILGKDQGLIESRDLAVLASHPEGVFKGFGGEKILVLAGVTKEYENYAGEVSEQTYLQNEAGITRILLTSGSAFGVQPYKTYKRS